MGQEIATGKDGKPNLDADGCPVSKVQAIVIDWLNSKDVKKQELAIRYAYGAPPTENRIAGPGGKELAPVMEWLEAPRHPRDE